MTYKFNGKATTVILTNTYGTDEYDQYKIANRSLESIGDLLEDTQFATGAASLGNPHIDEYDEKGKVIVDEKNGFAGAHAVSIRLFGSDMTGGGNQFVTLFPGDELKIECEHGPAALYYGSLKADGLKVTFDGDKSVDPVPYEAKQVAVFDTDAEYFLDRGTGVGDEESINFDSEAYTAEVINNTSV